MDDQNKTPETPEQATPQPDLEARIKELEAENGKLKAATSRANGEVADWKRKFQENVDKQRQDEIERAEREKADRAELERLRRAETVGAYKTKLMDAGIDPASADLMAQSLPDGVKDDYFTQIKTFNAAKEQQYRTAKVDSQPGLSVGTPPAGGDRESRIVEQALKYAGLK